jgi:hypothetical protein
MYSSIYDSDVRALTGRRDSSSFLFSLVASRPFQFLLRRVTTNCVWRSIVVSIGTWLEDCAISSLGVHLISLSLRDWEINARSIVLLDSLALHVTALQLVTSSSDALRMISNRMSALLNILVGNFK